MGQEASKTEPLEASVEGVTDDTVPTPHWGAGDVPKRVFTNTPHWYVHQSCEKTLSRVPLDDRKYLMLFKGSRESPERSVMVRSPTFGQALPFPSDGATHQRRAAGRLLCFPHQPNGCSKGTYRGVRVLDGLTAELQRTYTGYEPLTGNVDHVDAVVLLHLHPRWCDPANQDSPGEGGATFIYRR